MEKTPSTGETKSRAGNRVIGLPDELVAMLKLHREEQDRERDTAGQLWEEGGWVFTSPTGQPLNLNSDYHAWRALLKRAEVRNAGCMTRDTPPRQCSWCSVSRSGQ